MKKSLLFRFIASRYTDSLQYLAKIQGQMGGSLLSKKSSYRIFNSLSRQKVNCSASNYIVVHIV